MTIEKLVNSTIHPLIEQIFINKDKLLPNIEEYEKHIVTSATTFNDFDFSKSCDTNHFKYAYNKYSFPILNHEFFATLAAICKSLKINKIAEIMCGTGYFSYYATKYGINVSAAIDDYSHEPFTFKNNVLGFVMEDDAVKFILEHPDYEMFIMSFPYFSEAAATCWASLLPGQYLLYIGEDKDGGNADETFFKYIKDKELVEETAKLQESYINFWGNVTQPILLRK